MDSKQVHYETMCEMESSGVARLLALEHAHQRLTAIPRLLPSDLSAPRLDELLTQAPFDEVSRKLCFFVQQVSACAEGSTCRRRMAAPGLPPAGAGKAAPYCECECKAQRKVCACARDPRHPRSRCRCPRWNLRNTAPALSYHGCQVYRETLRWEEWDEDSCSFRMGDYIIHAYYLRGTAQPPRGADVAAFEAWRDSVTWHQDPRNPTGPRVRLAFCQARKEVLQEKPPGPGSRAGKRPRAVSPPFLRPPPCQPGSQLGTGAGKEVGESPPSAWGAPVGGPSPVQAHNSPAAGQQGQTRNATLGVLAPGASCHEVSPGEGSVDGGSQAPMWGTGLLGGSGEGYALQAPSPSVLQAPVGNQESPPLEGLPGEPLDEGWSGWLVGDQDSAGVSGQEETEGTSAASRAPRAASRWSPERAPEPQRSPAPEGGKKPLLERLMDAVKHPKIWRAKSPGHSKREGCWGLAGSPSRDAGAAGGLQASNGFAGKTSGGAGSSSRTGQESAAVGKGKEKKGKGKGKGKAKGSGQSALQGEWQLAVANQPGKAGPEFTHLEKQHGTMKPGMVEKFEPMNSPVLSSNPGTIPGGSLIDNWGSSGSWSFEGAPCPSVAHGRQAGQELPVVSAAGSGWATMAPYFSGSTMEPQAAAQWPLTAFPESAQAGGLTSLPVAPGVGGLQNAGQGAHLESCGEAPPGGSLGVAVPGGGAPDDGSMGSLISLMLEDGTAAAPSVNVIMAAAPYELEIPSSISPMGVEQPPGVPALWEAESFPQERLAQQLYAARRTGSLAQEESMDTMARSRLESQNQQEDSFFQEDFLDDLELDLFEADLLLDTASSPPSDHAPFMGEDIFRGLRDMGIAIQAPGLPKL